MGRFLKKSEDGGVSDDSVNVIKHNQGGLLFDILPNQSRSIAYRAAKIFTEESNPDFFLNVRQATARLQVHPDDTCRIATTAGLPGGDLPCKGCLADTSFPP